MTHRTWPVDIALMAIGHCIQFVGQCERDEEVFDRQQQILLLVQPLVDLVMAAARAVPIAAASVGVVKSSAVIATIDAAGLHVGGATADDVSDDLAMAGQSAGVLLQIHRAVPLEDVGKQWHVGNVRLQVLHDAPNCCLSVVPDVGRQVRVNGGGSNVTVTK